MTKLLFKAFILAFIFLAAGLYLNYLQTGKLPNVIQNKAVMPEFKFSAFKQSATNLLNTKPNKPEKKYMYRWRDSNNVIHYTSQKPETGVSYKSIELDNEVNIVPAVSESDSVNDKNRPELPSTPVNNVYSPEGVKQLFKQAKEIQKYQNEIFEIEDQL